MKKLSVVFSATAIVGIAVLAGCSTEGAISSQDAKAEKPGIQVVSTGSRIPRATTDRLVKSTERDRSDEPIRSIGNELGQKSN